LQHNLPQGDKISKWKLEEIVLTLNEGFVVKSTRQQVEILGGHPQGVSVPNGKNETVTKAIKQAMAQSLLNFPKMGFYITQMTPKQVGQPELKIDYLAFGYELKEGKVVQQTTNRGDARDYSGT
jgi:hypothetical protein